MSWLLLIIPAAVFVWFVLGLCAAAANGSALIIDEDDRL